MLSEEIDSKLDSIYPKVKEPSFRENKGLGNEVGYYIFDYPPEFELKVRNRVKSVKEKINNNSFGFKIIEFDLYDLVYKFLDEKGYKDGFFKIEEKRGTGKAANSLIKAINSKGHGWINDYITSHTPEDSVVFITGVGRVFPVLRSHTVLNTLHQQLDNVPVVLFFPGEYNGTDLSIFGSEDGYYRAFKF